MQPKPRLLLATVMLTALIAVGAAACSSGSSSSGSRTAAPAAATGTVVHIKNYAFSPSTLRVTAGAKVTFVNDDSMVHTATATNGSFDTGHINPGASKTVTVRGSGSIPYMCEIHQFMHGQLQITG